MTAVFAIAGIIGLLILIDHLDRRPAPRQFSSRRDASTREPAYGSTLMGWICDLIDPKARSWEEFYRNRWQYDRVVRSTHGVNCTGRCSWMIHVKDGIVTWEMQAIDYPRLDLRLPLYEPRGRPNRSAADAVWHHRESHRHDETGPCIERH